VYVPQTPEVYQYDLDGNLLQDGRWTYTWDAENRLIKIESLAAMPEADKRRGNYAYDHQGRRIWKRVDYRSGGNWTTHHERKFVYDGWNLTVELFTNNTAAKKFFPANSGGLWLPFVALPLNTPGDARFIGPSTHDPHSLGEGEKVVRHVKCGERATRKAKELARETADPANRQPRWDLLGHNCWNYATRIADRAAAANLGDHLRNRLRSAPVAPPNRSPESEPKESLAE
jgi:YD repeat-containing protein